MAPMTIRKIKSNCLLMTPALSVNRQRGGAACPGICLSVIKEVGKPRRLQTALHGAAASVTRQSK